MPLQLIFRDTNPHVAKAVATAFEGVTQLDAACASIFDAAPADAIISPANSHGWMDGGIDLLYVRRWGWHLQDANRRACAQQPEGHLPVGRAIVLETGGSDVPWLISAPTMFRPMPVPHTDNAYLAFRAALVVARERRLGRVLCPGLATLTGGMPPPVSAAQMRRAWDDVMR
ncbi:RNase III inhibitor [Halomonas sp. THAF12]|uniref:macro domain-containing protein n=1 Tax=Halomonas sp. THAF12 TaxID=2587849 RepID=UPI0012693F21|nr:macro domain-containing protein [Halomonas sp. THAF12]QFT84988.1 RNase III inhibitor [Halomonas sp. THAF12]